MRSLARFSWIAISAFTLQAQAALPIRHASLDKTQEAFIRYTDAYKTPQFFDDNEIALRARLKLLDQVPAGGTVKILTFLFDNGVATRTLAVHMCLAAKRGVNVQFLPDSKSGDRPGIMDVFDADFNNQVNEEFYQVLVNCGVKVRIHNHIPDFDVVAGKAVPVANDGSYVKGGLGTPFRWLGAKIRQGLGVIKGDVGTGLALKNNLSIFFSIFTEEIAKSKEEDQALLTELKDGLKSLVFESAKTYVLNRSEADNTKAIAEVAEKVQESIKTSKIVKKLKPETLRNFLYRMLNRVQTHEVLGKFYQQSRYFNRLNHRKLFWVESQGRSCMILGGRNLGDHYLTWDRHHDEFMDGDVLICNQHLKQGDRAVTEQGRGSFDQLWFNKDLEDPYNVKPSVTIVKPNLKFKYQYLMFPDYTTKEWGNPMWVIMPYDAASDRWSVMDYVTAKMRPVIGFKNSERMVPTPVVWNNETPFMGRSITGSMNWRVKLSTWNRAKDEVRAELYKAIDSEQERVYIETAYSEFSNTFRDHIEATLKRKVPVHIVTNSIYVSDAGSKAIRLIMARWTRQMLETYPSLFKIQFATIGFGHMIHFKGASFACQKSGHRLFRLNLVGSHNFHGRSGYSDKEHAIIWEQLPKASCAAKAGLKVATSEEVDLKDMRDSFYQFKTAKSPKNPPLKAFKTFEEEISDAVNSGKLSDDRKKTSVVLLNALYQHEKDPKTGKARVKKVAGRAVLKIHDEFMGFLEKLSESGLSDIIGALL